MAVLGVLTFTLSSMVVLTILRGLVFQALWAWFITTTFGLHELTLVQALGVGLVVTFLTIHIPNDDPDNDSRGTGEKMLAATCSGLVFYGFVFLTGAIIHGFA
jgi:hypothetical protein